MKRASTVPEVGDDRIRHRRKISAGSLDSTELELGDVRIEDLSVAFADAHIFRQAGP